MKKYILLFILSLIFFAIIKSPTSIFKQYFPNFKLSGKVINGTAIHQKIGIINWQFNPKLLLTTKVGVNIQINQGTNKIQATTGINLFGNIVINNANGVIETDYLRKFNNVIPNMAIATIKINNLDGIIEEKGSFIPTKMQAKLTIQKLNILGEKLGDYKINASIQNGKKLATISSTKNSIFKINANLNLNNATLNIKGNIIAKRENGKVLLQNFGISEKLDYKIPFKL